mmetsp:Transcript_1701/g.6558  ORF Transcript_1701/g.6558 Transcript_1701/m.6558 type:complete len:132 (-) Transcript_1701:847-1242(-)
MGNIDNTRRRSDTRQSPPGDDWRVDKGEVSFTMTHASSIYNDRNDMRTVVGPSRGTTRRELSRRWIFSASSSNPTAPVRSLPTSSLPRLKIWRPHQHPLEGTAPRYNKQQTHTFPRQHHPPPRRYGTVGPF